MDTTFTIMDFINYGIGQSNPELIKKYVEKHGDNELRLAINNDNVDLIKTLVQYGFKINYSLRYLLSIADCPNIVKYFIDQGEQDKKGEALKYSATCDKLKSLKVLLDNLEFTDYILNNIIHDCLVVNGRLDLIKLLLEYYKPDNLTEYMKTAVKFGRIDIIKFFTNQGVILTKDMISNSSGVCKQYLENIFKETYYGIFSNTKLELKLPGLEEIEKDSVYYYVYKCETKGKGYLVTDQLNKYNLLSSFGEVQFFTEI